MKRTVFGSSNFSKYSNEIDVSILKSYSFDLSNFYGYHSEILIEKGLISEITKFHPAAWFCSKRPPLWRLCNVMNNICRQLMIFKPKLLLVREICKFSHAYPNGYIGLHDFNSSRYMSYPSTLKFCRLLIDLGIDEKRLIICETKKSGCIMFEEYMICPDSRPLYYFGKHDISGSVRIKNYFRK